jgi:hypothetical protein
VKSNVATKSWENPNTLIAARQACLLVFQMPEVVEQVRQYFSTEAQKVPEANAYVNVQVRVLTCNGPLPEELAAKLNAAAKIEVRPATEGAESRMPILSVALLEEKDLRLIHEELVGGRKLMVALAPNVTTFNDQCAMLTMETEQVPGVSRPYFELLCRPRISRDGKRIWLHYRASINTLMQWATKSGPAGEVKVPISSETELCLPDGATALVSGRVSENSSAFFLISARIAGQESSSQAKEPAWGEAGEGAGDGSE